jgi:4-diphosphocytidyl-2-C-methyl-D-erythritol kinase
MCRMPVRSAAEVVARAPAKINLHLGVGALRADGFHELVTVFHAVGLSDEVTARPAEALRVSVRGPAADQVPVGERNLAWRAAALLAATAGRPPDVELVIDKAIPVAGGLAGGSADAAATLIACDALWGLDTPAVELRLLAAELGSDVPFALHGGTALGTGRGAHLQAVPTAVALHWVLVPADLGIATPAAYAELDRQRAGTYSTPPAGSPDDLLAALATGDVDAVAGLLTNDLQPAAIALAPGLAGVLDAGRAAGALAGIVSGSGPTVALLCRDPDDRSAVAAELDSRGYRSLVTSGPAPGASVDDRP